MPLYEYECKSCGYTFDKLSRLADPNPPCPCLLGDEVKNPDIRAFLTRAKEAFDAGRKVPYPGIPSRLVGPEEPYPLIQLENYHETTQINRTLGEWVALLTPCGGETKKLVSRSGFVLAGSGWAKDGY